MKTSTLIALIALSFNSFAGAGSPPCPPTRILDLRELHLDVRIKEGERSGELTHAEAAGLWRDLEKLNDREERAKHNGVVTRDEKVRLHAEAEKLSDEIFRLTHNKVQK